jgi:Trk-type K+ transport system membrane component
LEYLDALFMATSAATLAGLASVNMEVFNVYQQAILFCTMIFGSVIWVSQYAVWMRLSYFNRALKFVESHFFELTDKLDEEEPDKLTHLANVNRTMAPPGWPFNYQNYIDEPIMETTPSVPPPENSSTQPEQSILIVPFPQDATVRKRITFAEPSQKKIYQDAMQTLPSHLQGTLHPKLFHAQTFTQEDYLPSTHVGVDAHQRTTLAAFSQVLQAKTLNALPERNALILLTILIPVYILSWIMICTTILWIWIALQPNFQAYMASQVGNAVWVDPFWWTFFICVSSFVNCGLNILSVGAALLRNASSGPFLYILIWLIVAGNTLSPVFLRITVVIVRYFENLRLGRKDAFTERRNTIKTVPEGPGALSSEAPHKPTSRLLDACDFLLEHPRRVYTLLFDPVTTRWILIVNLIITMVGFILYLALEWNQYELLGFKSNGWDFFLSGFFQEVNCRSSGMSVFDLSDLNPGMWVWICVAMYIAVYPVALARKRTNIYVDRELDQATDRGDFVVAADGTITWLDQKKKRLSMDSYVAMQLKSQLTGELAFVILAIFLIAASENQNIKDDSQLNLFALIFEVISAFGTVGLSLGHVNSAVSLCAVLKPFSKVVLIFVMFYGRHRGLPSRIDKSVNLPGLAEVEEAGGLWLAMAPDQPTKLQNALENADE